MAAKIAPLARIRIAGPDRKGIIAAVTTYLFKSGCNIEDIDQRILDEILVMNMLVDTAALKSSVDGFVTGLKEAARKVGCDAQFQPVVARRIKKIALLVTREPQCSKKLIADCEKKIIKGEPSVILANRPDLEPLAKRHRIPFYWSPSDNKKNHELFILEKLNELDVDVIVLARYMQILSPEFCFRYEGKIINVHPSLLPSFPGARAYSQAFQKGVEVVGVTSHFVTTDLDQGPIICQDAFKVDKTRDTVESIAARGKTMEAAVLARAVKLFCEDRLSLRRGKVIDNQKIAALQKKTREFYQS